MSGPSHEVPRPLSRPPELPLTVTPPTVKNAAADDGATGHGHRLYPNQMALAHHLVQLEPKPPLQSGR